MCDLQYLRLSETSSPPEKSLVIVRRSCGRLNVTWLMLDVPRSRSSLWYARNLAIVAVVGAVLLVLALRMFTRVEGDFAEEL